MVKMLFKIWNNSWVSLLNNYKILGKVRKENKILVHENYRNIGSSDNILIFERKLEEEKSYCNNE